MRLQVDAWPKNLHVGNGGHRDVFIRGRFAAQSVDPSKGPPDKTRPKGRGNQCHRMVVSTIHHPEELVYYQSLAVNQCAVKPRSHNVES